MNIPEENSQLVASNVSNSKMALVDTIVVVKYVRYYFFAPTNHYFPSTFAFFISFQNKQVKKQLVSVFILNLNFLFCVRIKFPKFKKNSLKRNWKELKKMNHYGIPYELKDAIVIFNGSPTRFIFVIKLSADIFVYLG